MPPVLSDTQILVLGTPAQKKALQRRQMREKFGEPEPRAETKAEPSPAPVAGPPEGDEAAIEIEKLRKELARREAVDEVNKDLYGKLEDKDAYIRGLENERNRAVSDAKSLRREKGGLDSNLDDLERQVASLDREKKHIKELYEDTKRELAGFKADKNNVQQWNITLQADYDDLDKKYKKARYESDLRASDLEVANQQIDKLTRRLDEQNGEEMEKARAYMQHINDALDPVFEEQGKDLTPDSFREHFDRISHQANLHRHASGTSLNSLQNDKGHKRNDSGVRKPSLGDELANHEDNAFESDSDGVADLDETLRIPKQRKRSSLHFQDIESKLSEKDQEITRQREHIQKLEEESLSQKKAMKEQEEKLNKEHEEDSASKEKIINDYHQEVIKQKQKIAEQEHAIERERYKNTAAPAKKTWGRKKQNIEHDAEEGATTTADDTIDAPLSSNDEKNKVAEQVLTVRPVIKYHEKVRDATIWEAIMNAPWWHRLLFAVFVIICLTSGLAGFATDYAWRNANSHVVDGIRYAQINYGQISWRTWIEDFVGYDSMLLG